MAYVNKYQLSSEYILASRKIVVIAGVTYVLGMERGLFLLRFRMFIARLDDYGNVVWTKFFQNPIYYAPILYWTFPQISDLYGTSGNTELIALGYERRNIIIFKLRASDGQLLWHRRIYDAESNQSYNENFVFQPRMHQLADGSLIVKTSEYQVNNEETVDRTALVLLKVNPDNGLVLLSRRLLSNALCDFIDEKVFGNELHLFGGYLDGNGIHIRIDRNLNLISSHALVHDTPPLERVHNNFSIHWVGNEHNGRYLIMGSYDHVRLRQVVPTFPFSRWGINTRVQIVLTPILIDWLPIPVSVLDQRITRFFIAEVNLADQQIMRAATIDRDFEQSFTKTLHSNAQGHFVSFGDVLYKINNNFTGSEEGKTIPSPLTPNGGMIAMLINPHVDSSHFYAYSLSENFTSELAYAKTNLDYESCLTQKSGDQPTLTSLPLRYEPTDFHIEDGVLPDYVPLEFKEDSTNFTVTTFCGEQENNVILDEKSRLQSAFLQMQSVGSNGLDSTAGIHSRWIFKDKLLNHLPKGNYFTGTPFGLNKPDDFITLKRAVYTPEIGHLNFNEQPYYVHMTGGYWGYLVNGKTVNIYFRNLTRYNQLRSMYNPMTDWKLIIENYQNDILDIEVVNGLFFAFQLHMEDVDLNPIIRLEALSTYSAATLYPKKTSIRRRFTSTAAASQKMFVDNGRNIRFTYSNAFPLGVYLEFYDDFISKTNIQGAWEVIDRYSLTTDDAEADYRLEPSPQERPVHAKWPRYNDGEYVNIENYRQKWNGSLPDPRNRIKNSVEKYLQLSNSPSNPLANETFYLNDIPPAPGESDTGMQFSHLTLLQMAALDFHVARMLGQGYMDVSNEIYGGQRYVYVAEYTTFADLEDGNGANEARHIAMGLPTGIYDYRQVLPVVLKPPVPGMFVSGDEPGSLSPITSADGYTHDGTARYISLFTEVVAPNEPETPAFFAFHRNFNMSEFTYPVFAGIKDRNIEEPQWRKPELPHDKEYSNVNAQGQISNYETISVLIPEPGLPAYVHRVNKTGKHVYGSYGIDWFSRSTLSGVNHVIESVIRPANVLLPPSSVNALLIQQEAPLLLTSGHEQEMLTEITSQDKTFVRLTFGYDSAQDMISYLKAVNGVDQDGFDPPPVSEEIFADQVAIFFRPELPRQLFGTITDVEDHPNNPMLSVVSTGAMNLTSSGEVLYPEIQQNEIPHYIGSVFQSGDTPFIIHEIIVNPSSPQQPVLHVLKKQLSAGFEDNTVSYDPTDFVAPQAGSSFMIVENMQNHVSWEQENPHPFLIDIGSMWNIHEEEVTIQAGEGSDITLNTYFRRYRGFWNTNVTVSKYVDEFFEGFQGVYMLVFHGFQLAHHPQFSDQTGVDHVDWYGGTVRIPYESDPMGERKVLQVLRMENIGTSADLIVFAQDQTYQTDPLQTSESRGERVNLYPGYRVYLYTNPAMRLTETHTLPQDDETLDKYSIFGLETRWSVENAYISGISIPAVMFGRWQEAPHIPQKPTGAIYATRPDYYGRSSFTFNTQYTHKPFALMFVRSNDDLLLSSLYIQTPYGAAVIPDSVEDIRIHNDDIYFNDRLIALANAEVDGENLFPDVEGYRFPLPNNPRFFDSINTFVDEHNAYYGDNVPHVHAGNFSDMGYVVIPEVPGRNSSLTVLDFVKETVGNTYVPLTELPVIYNYIRGGNYQPKPGLQVVRNRDGNLLHPTDPAFDIAPMVKILGTQPHKTQFTDFTLDGNSTSVYFYAVREVNSQMQQGGLSPAIGPVRMVNSYAIYPPEIVSITPILENPVLGITPAVEIAINAYDAIRNIKKLHLYRALEPSNAYDIRNMELVATVDLESSGVLSDALWIIRDDFSDLEEVPFGDPFYYRVTVEAAIEYAAANYSYDDQNPNNTFDIVTDFAPSEPSKLLITTVTDNVVPASPILDYIALQTSAALLSGVVFEWEKQAYNAKYYLYKMNTQGNWVQIAVVQGNEDAFELPLVDTDWGTDELIIKDADGNTVYHHFKILTENTAGMFSTEEIVLTIPSE